jgi:hypothetical protein
MSCRLWIASYFGRMVKSLNLFEMLGPVLQCGNALEDRYFIIDKSFLTKQLTIIAFLFSAAEGRHRPPVKHHYPYSGYLHTLFFCGIQ